MASASLAHFDFNTSRSSSHYFFRSSFSSLLVILALIFLAMVLCCSRKSLSSLVLFSSSFLRIFRRLSARNFFLSAFCFSLSTLLCLRTFRLSIFSIFVFQRGASGRKKEEN